MLRNPAGRSTLRSLPLVAVFLFSSYSRSDQPLEFATLLADLEGGAGHCCWQYCDSQAQRADFGDCVDDVQTPGESR